MELILQSNLAVYISMRTLVWIYKITKDRAGEQAAVIDRIISLSFRYYNNINSSDWTLTHTIAVCQSAIDTVRNMLICRLRIIPDSATPKNYSV